MAQDDQGVDSTLVADDVEELRHVGFRLLVLTGELRGREFEVVQDTVRLGKSRQCNIVLPDESVSRVHSEIRREGDAYRCNETLRMLHNHVNFTTPRLAMFLYKRSRTFVMHFLASNTLTK